MTQSNLTVWVSLQFVTQLEPQALFNVLSRNTFLSRMT